MADVSKIFNKAFSQTTMSGNALDPFKNMDRSINPLKKTSAYKKLDGITKSDVKNKTAKLTGISILSDKY